MQRPQRRVTVLPYVGHWADLGHPGPSESGEEDRGLKTGVGGGRVVTWSLPLKGRPGSFCLRCLF